MTIEEKQKEEALKTTPCPLCGKPNLYFATVLTLKCKTKKCEFKALAEGINVS